LPPNRAFSREAEEYTSRSDPKIVLIDGSRLTTLVIDYNVGVTPVQTHEVKRLDSDYFADE
jgi:restriction system protein